MFWHKTINSPCVCFNINIILLSFVSISQTISIRRIRDASARWNRMYWMISGTSDKQSSACPAFYQSLEEKGYVSCAIHSTLPTKLCIMLFVLFTTKPGWKHLHSYPAGGQSRSQQQTELVPAWECSWLPQSAEE